MLYATVALIVVIILSSTSGKIKQGNMLPIVGSAVVLCIFAGLRNSDYGDLIGYSSMYFDYVPYVSYSQIWTTYIQGEIKDGLFYITMKVFSDAGFSYQLFIAFVTSFYVIAVTFLIAKHSEIPTISFLMFFILEWFRFAFTGLRQAIALGFCVLAFVKLIENPHSLKAFILIGIAGLFHSSAWIFFVAPIISRLNIKVSKKLFIIIAVFSVLSATVGASIYRNIIQKIAWNDSLSRYADSKVSLTWSGFIIQLMFSGASYVFYDDVVKKNSSFAFIYTLMVIGLLFQAFSSVVAESFRISMYFSISSICAYPAAIVSIKQEQYKKIAYLVSIMLLISYFFYSGAYSTYVPIL